MSIGYTANARIADAAQYVGEHLADSSHSETTHEYLEVTLELLREADARLRDAIEIEGSP